MVIVVGGGPAGATAARALARAGVTVRLLDRSNFPRNKPCGGGISARALRRFPWLAAGLEGIATHHVSRLYLEGPDGESTVVESDIPAAMMIRRVEFDHLLVSLAVDAGAELVEGVEVVHAAQGRDSVSLVARDGRKFEAAVVIAADGVHSGTARRLGIRKAWPAHAVALDMMEETPRALLAEADPHALWVAYGFDPERGNRDAAGERLRRAPEGYAYIFPKREHVNVGVGYVLAHYREAFDASPYELQKGFVNHLRSRGIVRGESSRKNFTPFLLPVGGPLRRPGRGRVLVAGDAAGFVNGFTAEGIYYAMVSGELAARSVIEASTARGASLVRRYSRACEAEIGSELRDAVLLQRYMFADRRRIAALIKGAHRAPALTRAVLDFVTGRTGYGTLRRTMLARAPSLAVRLVWERFRAAVSPQPVATGEV
jgi:geranylgeranyl reductase family protein